MSVGEEGHRTLLQGFDPEISIPGNEDGCRALFIQKIGQAVGVLVEKAVYGVVQLPVVDRGRSLQHGQADGQSNYYYRFRLGEYGLGIKLIRHPGLKGRVLPALHTCYPQQGDLHLPASSLDSSLYIFVHGKQLAFCIHL